MDDEQEREARSAAQGLLDIAFKHSQRPMEDRSSLGKRKEHPIQSSSSGRDHLNEPRANSPTRIPAFRPIASRAGTLYSGRTITSGNAPPVIKPKDDSPAGFRPPDARNKEKGFFQPKPKPKPKRPQDILTLVVSKPPPEEAEAQPVAEEVKDRHPSFDLPVPPSAFAIPGRQSAAESIGPRSRLSEVPREPDSGSASDEEIKRRAPQASARLQPPTKRSRLDRTFSISAALQQVNKGADDTLAGRPPQTLHELMPWSDSSKRQRDSQPAVPLDTMEIAQRLWGAPPAPPGETFRREAPHIMPRNSSDRSTLEMHKQIARQISGETIANYLNTPRKQNGDRIERDQQDIRQHPSVLSAQTLIGSAPLPSDATDDKLPPATSLGGHEDPPKDETQDATTGQQAEDVGSQVWTGQIKHRLKTPAGSTSVAELFHVHLQIPSQLMEQIPPTIFINVIVGRQQVKLGRHHVSNCRLVDPTDEALQKATALAIRKLVLICELQHCTITLVPHIAEQGLRLVAFLIADE